MLKKTRRSCGICMWLVALVRVTMVSMRYGSVFLVYVLPAFYVTPSIAWMVWDAMEHRHSMTMIWSQYQQLVGHSFYCHFHWFRDIAHCCRCIAMVELWQSPLPVSFGNVMYLLNAQMRRNFGEFQKLHLQFRWLQLFNEYIKRRGQQNNRNKKIAHQLWPVLGPFVRNQNIDDVFVFDIFAWILARFTDSMGAVYSMHWASTWISYSLWMWQKQYRFCCVPNQWRHHCTTTHTSN